jgi:hypothetical protein
MNLVHQICMKVECIHIKQLLFILQTKKHRQDVTHLIVTTLRVAPLIARDRLNVSAVMGLSLQQTIHVQVSLSLISSTFTHNKLTDLYRLVYSIE